MHCIKTKKNMSMTEKSIFKIVAIANILTNAQIFNYSFVDKIKNINSNNAYKKIWLVLQIYNNPEKDLVLTQLVII